jgi:hypothetical protein
MKQWCKGHGNFFDMGYRFFFVVAFRKSTLVCLTTSTTRSENRNLISSDVERRQEAKVRKQFDKALGSWHSLRASP